MTNRSREAFGLPFRPFLYTLDQISDLLSVEMSKLKREFLWYQGRSPGVRPPARMECVNLSMDGDKPEWRVTETELMRYLRYKGFRIYDRVKMY